MKDETSAVVMPMTGGISSVKYAGNDLTFAAASNVLPRIFGNSASDTQNAKPPENRVDA